MSESLRLRRETNFAADLRLGYSGIGRSCPFSDISVSARSLPPRKTSMARSGAPAEETSKILGSRWTVSQTQPMPRMHLIISAHQLFPRGLDCRQRAAELSSAVRDGNCRTIEGTAAPKSADAFSCQCPQAIIFFGSPFIRIRRTLQCPKIIAPNVKTAAKIQITTAARFSER
jgi:hypothetical protein